jgi:hypothetical protein
MEPPKYKVGDTVWCKVSNCKARITSIEESTSTEYTWRYRHVHIWDDGRVGSEDWESDNNLEEYNDDDPIFHVVMQIVKELRI